ncbi:alpha/beta hydrolase [Streptomyces sp. NPDC001714]|uniref:alpha/beta hydrolase n=1 Tax=Streptomyces sp. NPDC001714 TaxID=3364603 RepID=UPI0036788EF8
MTGRPSPGEALVNDLDELKQHVVVHARTQGIPPSAYLDVLGRIEDDGEGGPGSWVAEWSRAGDLQLADGRPFEAFRFYNIARFPYPAGETRRSAARNAVAAFDTWRKDIPGLTRVDVDLPDGLVRCWAGGLSTEQPKPLLLLMGGIVSTKEQYAPALAQAPQLDMAGVVTELPGVGENTLPYRSDSWRMIPAVLDALADRADVSRTYAVALSFSGHLALRAAVHDKRIRGVVTTGAPVHDFFADTRWQARVPTLTLDTLAHLTGTRRAGLADELRDWALTDDELGALDIPVAYAASSRDEIIPPTDPARLHRTLDRLELIEKDDVHGSPEHVEEIRLWTLLSALRMCGDRPAQVAFLESALQEAAH